MTRFARNDWVIVVRDTRADRGSPRTNPIGLRGTVLKVDGGWVRCRWPAYGSEFSLPAVDLNHVAEPRPVLYATGPGGFAEVDVYTHPNTGPHSDAVSLSRFMGRHGIDRTYWVGEPVGTCFRYTAYPPTVKPE